MDGHGPGGTRLEPALLMIDVGGLSGANGTLDALALVRTLCACFAGGGLKALVIKSSCLRNLARTLRHSTDLQEAMRRGDAVLASPGRSPAPPVRGASGSSVELGPASPAN